MNILRQLLLAGLFVTSMSSLVHADVRMPALFGDHMVLQRDRPLPVWGWAEPSERVRVSLGTVAAETVADQQGKWQLSLPAMEASHAPLEMVVSGRNRIVIKDVLVGDVWVCAGQSNMERTVLQSHNAKQALSEADLPAIRFFQVGRKIAFEPQADCAGQWVVCELGSPALRKFSAVAYFFGKEIFAAQGMPVGLIGTYRGGSPAEAWTSLEKLGSVPALQHYVEAFEETKIHLPELVEVYNKETLPAWRLAVKAWEAKPAPRGPKPRWPLSPSTNPRQPTVLFNGMVNPIIPFAIKGIIWYQGENNGLSTEHASEYAVLFPAMIADWRERWGQGDFPFLYVQLASYQTKQPENDWPRLRESQRQALTVPETAMAVSIDIGEQFDSHPKNKVDVGKRLALAARHVAYGEDIVYSGPMVKSMHTEGTKAVLRFEHIGSGLTIGVPPPIRMGQKPQQPSSSLQSFEIAGVEGEFFPAEAIIQGDTLVVSSPEVKAPVAVRYAWAAWPDPRPNLYNRDGLPASPFTVRLP